MHRPIMDWLRLLPIPHQPDANKRVF